jgi:hypothetical protein
MGAGIAATSPDAKNLNAYSYGAGERLADKTATLVFTAPGRADTAVMLAPGAPMSSGISACP